MLPVGLFCARLFPEIENNLRMSVKPRFDKKGSLFGLLHRELGNRFLMLDLDYMVLEVNGEMKEHVSEDTRFVEYRRAFNRNILFKAIFEIKFDKTVFSTQMLNTDNTNTKALIEMACRLNSRLFIVFATYGLAPFIFYEYSRKSDDFVFAGELNFDYKNARSAIRYFWYYCLGIEE